MRPCRMFIVPPRPTRVGFLPQSGSIIQPRVPRKQGRACGSESLTFCCAEVCAARCREPIGCARTGMPRPGLGVSVSLPGMSLPLPGMTHPLPGITRPLPGIGHPLRGMDRPRMPADRSRKAADLPLPAVDQSRKAANPSHTGTRSSMSQQTFLSFAASGREFKRKSAGEFSEVDPQRQGGACSCCCPSRATACAGSRRSWGRPR